MDQKQPLYAVTAHWSTHIGGYVGLAFTALLAVAAWIFSAWLGIAVAAAAVLGLVMLELVRRSERLAFYDDGVSREFRLISTRKIFAEYDAIQDLEVSQSFFQRVLGVGTVHINTAGDHGPEIVFAGVDRPHELEDAIRVRMRKSHAVDTPPA